MARRRKGTMTEETIHSKYLNEDMVLKIYHPPAFSPMYTYHICIMQDGDDYYQMGRLATLSDRLHEDVEITNTVFVGIHYADRQDRLRKYHPEGEQFEAYTKFLAFEVVSLLDELLPTYELSQSRVLMGDSLAGTIALLTAIKYPHTFGKVILQSPLVDDAVLELLDASDTINGLEIYHTIGTAETEVYTTIDPRLDFLTPNRTLSERLVYADTIYTYHELEDGLHTWKFWQDDLKRALKTILY